MDWQRGNIPYFEFPPKLDEDGNEIPDYRNHDLLKPEDLEIPKPGELAALDENAAEDVEEEEGSEDEA